MSLYSNFDNDELIVRDYLATDRTILANERTFLAYLRTTLALFISGASFIKFVDIFVIQLIGWLLLPSAVITLVIGIIRYNRVKKSLFNIKKNRSSVAPNPIEIDYLEDSSQENISESIKHESFIQDWIDEAEMEALQKGRQEGYTNAYRETVAILLEDKFGIIRPNVLDALEKVNQTENLKALVRKAPKVETQDEFLNLVKIAIGE